jgi:hypothetical protein
MGDVRLVQGGLRFSSLVLSPASVARGEEGDEKRVFYYQTFFLE